MKEMMMPAKNQEAVKIDADLSKKLAEQAILDQQKKESLNIDNNEKIEKKTSLEDLEAQIEIYRANIKKGETKNERGQYDEALVLENEAKLRTAEKEKEILVLKKEISTYRQIISDAEKKFDEKTVLENEAKLHEIEQKILAIKERNLKPESEVKPEIKSYDENGDPIFVEADPSQPITKRLSETPDGLEEWQIQATTHPDIFKINRGFGWGEISKSQLEEMKAKMPEHTNSEEEINKIREELKNESDSAKSENLLKKRLEEEKKKITDISDLILLAGEAYLNEDPELKKFAFQLWSSDKVIKEIGGGFKNMDGEKEKEVIDKISNICSDKNLFIEKIKKLKEESEIEESETKNETKIPTEILTETPEKSPKESPEEAPKPAEVPKTKKPKKSFWSGLKSIWSKK